MLETYPHLRQPLEEAFEAAHAQLAERRAERTASDVGPPPPVMASVALEPGTLTSAL